MKSNIPDDSQILISIGNWEERAAHENRLRRRSKKVNSKWHVNVMRSHVKWYFLSQPDTASARRTKQQKVDSRGDERKWEKCGLEMIINQR